MEKEKYITHTHLIIVIVAVLALILSIISLVRTSGDKTNVTNEISSENIKNGEDVMSYKLYIGLTDKKKNRQVVDIDVAIEMLKAVCVSKKVTYTIYEAQGTHKDDEGIMHAEKTLILEMDHIDDAMLEELANEISKRLNVQEIMITKNPIKAYYYSRQEG